MGGKCHRHGASLSQTIRFARAADAEPVLCIDAGHSSRRERKTEMGGRNRTWRKETPHVIHWWLIKRCACVCVWSIYTAIALNNVHTRQLRCVTVWIPTVVILPAFIKLWPVLYGRELLWKENGELPFCDGMRLNVSVILQELREWMYTSYTMISRRICIQVLELLLPTISIMCF
jgi:hypothetical protein